MSSQYIVKHNRAEDSFDVYHRQVFTNEELAVQSEALVADGWSATEAIQELKNDRFSFVKCNTDTSRKYTLRACQEFIVSYAAPGDIMVILGVVYMINQPGRA